MIIIMKIVVITYILNTNYSNILTPLINELKCR